MSAYYRTFRNSSTMKSRKVCRKNFYVRLNSKINALKFIFSGNNAQRYNRFRTTKFDKNFKTHSLCESWNSGKQSDNFEWYCFIEILFICFYILNTFLRRFSMLFVLSSRY